WGTQTATTNSTLSGNGTGANPLGIAQQGAATGQVLKWNGSTWVPSTDLIGSSGGDNWGTQTVVTSSALTGGGTFASPLGLAQQGAANGQVLKWNGATWAPANDIDNDAQSLSFIGNTLTISNGNSVTLPTPINYSAGAGINIAGNVISNTGDLSSTNELQTLSIAANQLSISNGNSVVLPSTNYTAGTGINITGSVITNTSPDQVVTVTGTGSASVTSAYPNFTINATDAQTLSLAGTTISISNGNSVTLPSQLNYTSGTGINIAGTVISNTAPDQLVSLNGTGATTVTGAYPNFTINSVDNDAQTLSLAGTTISISNGNAITLPAQLNYTAGTGIGIAGTVITNSAPDQIVSLTGTGGATVTGAYPNFTVNSTDADAQTLSIAGNSLSILNGNTVTLPAQTPYTAGTGIGIAGTVITNSAPDQIVTLTGTGASTVTGAYPNFTVNSTDADAQTLSLAGNILTISNGNNVTLPTGTTYTAGSGIGIAGNVISNTSPDQIVTITGIGMSAVTGTYPNFTVNSLVITDPTLSGNGTGGTPLRIAQQGATVGQALKWNGTTWLPSNDNDVQTLSLVGNTLSISNGNNVTLPASTSYSAGNGLTLAGTTFNLNAITDATLSGNGTPLTPLKIAQQGAVNGDVLQWNGTSWVPTTIASVITLGQSTTSVFGTTGLVVPVNSAFNVIPGLSQIINVPAGYSAFITTAGGVVTSSATAGGYSVVDIIIGIDGGLSPNGGYQRVIVGNSLVTSTFTNWAMHLAPILAPGVHTINVQAAGPNQAGAVPCTVSSNNTSVLQGELTITIIKN
ncbi:MAG: hypothetical protein WCI97_02475, partial [Bacteroidota bacterium]